LSDVTPPSSERRNTPIVGGWSRQDKHADHAALAPALRELREDTVRMATSPELQLVVQFCDQGAYPAWATGWRAAWTKAGVQTPTLLWPRGLPTGQVAALLLPLPAGRVGPAVGRHPSPVFEPLLVHALLPDDVGARDFGLNLILRWLESRADGQGARLAPPVLELTQGGRVTRRALETYGLEWDLPAPDGL